MNVEHERSRSLWMDLPEVDAPPLPHDIETDVLVIGAGIAGLSTAYELALSGRKVTVVDRGRPGRGMTARSSAHLAYEIDDYYRELIRHRDVAAARQYFASQSAAVDRIEGIVDLERIDCEFQRVDGYLVPATDDEAASLRQELDAAVQAGFVDAVWLDRGPAPWDGRPAIRFPRQARFHPLKYLQGLLSLLHAHGGQVFGSTPVVKLEEDSAGILATCEDRRRIRARAAVVATNSPFHLMIPVHTKQAPYRTYVLAADVAKGTVPDALVWDTLEPAYHYVRLQPGREKDRIIVGGEDHKTGEEDDVSLRFSRLEHWTRSLFPGMGAVTHRWSGQVMEPADYVPFVGHSPKHRNVWLVTGDSGEGLTTGVAASLILRELVNGRDHRWAGLYDPSRSMLHGLREYVSENVDATRHWAAHLGRGDVDTLDRLGPGQGGIVKIHGDAVAAYRTPLGELLLHNATCTHAGCVVRWNGFERCWDCPCHGSQFSIDGEPLQGPATRPLHIYQPPLERRRASGE